MAASKIILGWPVPFFFYFIHISYPNDSFFQINQLVGVPAIMESWEQEARPTSEVPLATWPALVSSPLKITTFSLLRCPVVLKIHVLGLRMARFSAGDEGLPVSMGRTRTPILEIRKKGLWISSIRLFSKPKIRRFFSLSDILTRTT